MTNFKTNTTRAQLISQLKDGNISRTIDKMDVHKEYNFILLDECKKAAANPVTHYAKKPHSMVTCRVYVTSGAGMYGYQFQAAIWINVNGQYYQASGAKTSGCGYDKISAAIDDAVRFVGVDHKALPYFHGTGEHVQALCALADKLAGRKSWVVV